MKPKSQDVWEDISPRPTPRGLPSEPARPRSFCEPGDVLIWDVPRGLLHRGWLQNARFRSRQHGKQHWCNTDTACNNVFFETNPFETTPYASPDSCRALREAEERSGEGES